MRFLAVIPEKTRVPCMRFRHLFIGLSVALVVASVALGMTKGLNLGIDFRGGIMIELRSQAPADLGHMRGIIGGLGLGEVSLQEFGDAREVLIHFQQQEGDESAQQHAVETVKQVLAKEIVGKIDYRRVEFVGPKVSAELFRSGLYAVLFALGSILIYVAFRFEWQYGISGVLALVHDVVATVGLFSLTQMEFNLTIVAALLTIAGYSINDTVVVFDRVRENLRKYKTMPLADLIDLSVNETFARTIITSATTLLSVLAIAFFGGEVIRGFAIAMIFGIVVGTYSSVFVASALVLYFPINRAAETEPKEAQGRA
ncbi:MAG: protein translocase subunit SecF [Alphaproteobacteria bacterium]|nr:protein translocase subunit SecF [Alphaproteobacteria bacterium]